MNIKRYLIKTKLFFTKLHAGYIAHETIADSIIKILSGYRVSEDTAWLPSHVLTLHKMVRRPGEGREEVVG